MDLIRRKKVRVPQLMYQCLFAWMTAAYRHNVLAGESAAKSLVAGDVAAHGRVIRNVPL